MDRWREEWTVSKVDALLKCGLLILMDACPPDSTAYACRGCDYDADCCGDCWRAYLFAVANGRKQLPRLPISV